MLLFSVIISNYEDHDLFMLILFNRSVVTFLLKFFLPYQALHLFSTGVLSEIFLTPCSIHSIVPEAVCRVFIQVSSHLIKFLFNSFSSQPECCPKLFLPCSSFLMECFQLRSSPLFSFLKIG